MHRNKLLKMLKRNKIFNNNLKKQNHRLFSINYIRTHVYVDVHTYLNGQFVIVFVLLLQFTFLFI